MVALEAIPAAAFLVRSGGTNEHANATGRLLLVKSGTSLTTQIRVVLANPTHLTSLLGMRITQLGCAASPTTHSY